MDRSMVKRVFEETRPGNVSLTRNKRPQGLRSSGRGHFYRIRANVRAQQESGYHYKIIIVLGGGRPDTMGSPGYLDHCVGRGCWAASTAALFAHVPKWRVNASLRLSFF